ncbi:hypothetical protein PoB_001186900 [Plakobranchus ocellatus]|uniref:Uncharacterized protein n=1 Tax=Plakobranchus ocellatus TaxID=259542 RepID=A0AAV3YQN2_9GAST|nr:hypothetical protein PoB_001186900 [Plakobranchus ocellatus]
MLLDDNSKPNVDIDFHYGSVLHLGWKAYVRCWACLESTGNFSWIVIDKSSLKEQRVSLTDPRVTFSSGENLGKSNNDAAFFR